jgi:hypothetical protein
MRDNHVRWTRKGQGDMIERRRTVQSNPRDRNLQMLHIMISLRALEARQLGTFKEDPHSWRDRNEIVMRRSQTLWGKYWMYVGKHQWPARVVLLLATITVLYLTVVFGYLIGVGLFYQIG